jgi:hypothetical protein
MTLQGGGKQAPGLKVDGALGDPDEAATAAPPREVPARPAERFGGLITRMSFRPPASMTGDETTEMIAALRGIPALNDIENEGGQPA